MVILITKELNLPWTPYALGVGSLFVPHLHGTNWETRKADHDICWTDGAVCKTTQHR